MQLNSTNSSTDNRHLLPEPIAWIAILGLVIFTALCIAIGAGQILRPGYIVLSFAVGVLLYVRYPVIYVGFTWWIWFVTPLISRLIDYRTNFDPSRLILVSQYLVTLISLHCLLKNLPRAYREGGLPFILAFLGVFYAFLVGLIKTSPMTAARGLLDWLTPISFSFYLFINWRDYLKYRQIIQRVFVWGVLIAGTYGIVQYLIAPDWDRFWLINTKLTSMGQPEPLKLRVWSTMASPGPFAVMMMAGLLILLTTSGSVSVTAAGVGYLAFLLSTVRTMWGSWFVGLITLFGSLKPRLQMRLMVTILIMAICVIPLTTIEPFSTAINTRIQSFSNLESDDSAQTRKKIYRDGLTSAMSNGLGNGIGNTFIVDKNGVLSPIVIDSGILDIFFTLGWFGATFYVGGLILLIFNLLQYSEYSFDPFMAAARAIGLGCFAALPGFSIMLGYSGIFLWSFLALATAAHKYHQQQRQRTIH